MSDGTASSFLARSFVRPIRLSPVVEPSVALAFDMEGGDLEGIVLKDREAADRDGSRAAWFHVKDRRWTGVGMSAGRGGSSGDVAGRT